MNLKLDEQWVETIMLILLVVGFAIAVLITTPAFTYVTTFLAGFISARIYHIKKLTEPILPVVLIIAGFLVGYLVGNLWSSRILALFFYALGFGISLYLHRKNIITTFKSELFLK